MEGLEKGITFFTGWGDEKSDVPFHDHLQFSEKTTRYPSILMSNPHSANKMKNVAGIQNFSDVFSPILSKMGILAFHADGFADECVPLPTWQFSSQQKMSRENSTRKT